jgi:TM2 domain-containing membrane protein YozV
VTSEGWKRLICVVVAVVFVSLLAAVAARRPKALGRATTAAVLGWLLPGAGHLWLGRVRKGLVLGLLVSGTFVAGALLARGRTVTFDENPFYYIGQIGSGLTLGVTQTLASNGLPPVNSTARPEVDAGLLYMSVAGLLNLLLVLNLFDLVLGIAPGGAAKKPAPEAPPAA